MKESTRPQGASLIIAAACALSGALVTLAVPVGADPLPVKPAAARSFVHVGTRSVSCRRANPTYRSGRRSRCRPARDAIPESFGQPGVLEYGQDTTLGVVAGKRHVVATFREDASDCDIIRMLCAVRGDLVQFMPAGPLGAIAFPWVQTSDDLDAALRSLDAYPVVSAASHDVQLSTPEGP